MDTHRAAIEDNGTPKAFDDEGLSERAADIAKRVAQAHARWVQLATWGASALGRDPKTLTAREAMAVETYYNLRKKVTWPLWSTRQSDDDVKGMIFAIQATFNRMRRLVPDAFPNAH
jgi:hypothetical protein